jgi:hypothetical protein
VLSPRSRRRRCAVSPAASVGIEAPEGFRRTVPDCLYLGSAHCAWCALRVRKDEVSCHPLKREDMTAVQTDFRAARILGTFAPAIGLMVTTVANFITSATFRVEAGQE